MSDLREKAVSAGMDIATRFFAKRGGRVEAHLSKAQVASLVALGYEMGAEAMVGKMVLDNFLDSVKDGEAK